jgi:hypothetical protein
MTKTSEPAAASAYGEHPRRDQHETRTTVSVPASVPCSTRSPIPTVCG